MGFVRADKFYAKDVKFVGSYKAHESRSKEKKEYS